MEEIFLLQGMNDSQRTVFQAEMSKARKNRTTGFLLNLFLGGVGGHHFYLGNTGLGLLYLLFCWTFIPGLISLIELFFIMGRIDGYNESKAEEIAIKTKALVPSTPASSPVSASSADSSPSYPPVDTGATVMLRSEDAEARTIFLGHFNVLTGPERGKKIPIYGLSTGQGAETTIGREKAAPERSQAHIHFDDPAISRKQAKLLFEEGQYQILNLSRTNPTKVNGRVLGVDERALLFSGNSVRFGDIEMAFEA